MTRTLAAARWAGLRPSGGLRFEVCLPSHARMRSLVLGLALLVSCVSTAGLSSGGSPAQNTDPSEHGPPVTPASPPPDVGDAPAVAPPPPDAGDAGACGDAAFCDDFDGVPNDKLWTLSGATDAAHGVDALAWLSS